MKELARLTRLKDWSYLLGIPLLAAIRARPDFGASLASFTFCSSYFCWGYVFNDFYDRREDLPTRNVLKLMSDRKAAMLAYLTAVPWMAMAVSWDFSLASIFVATTNALYSIDPPRLKRFLPTSLACNGVFFGFAYYASTRINRGGSTMEDLWMSAYVFLLFLPIQYVHHLEHRTQEGKANPVFHRVAIVFWLAPLCLCAALSPLYEITGLSGATSAYAWFLLVISLMTKNGELARRRTRAVSMIFGVFLVAIFAYTSGTI